MQLCTAETCTRDALEDFKRLVRQGGQVNEATLPKLLKTASALAMVQDQAGKIIGTGALKVPNESYRTKVFKNAGVTGQGRYAFELGWVVVDDAYSGRRMATAIVSKLVSNCSVPLYATSRTSKKAMHKALVTAGFELAGAAYRSAEVQEGVLLFVCRGSL